MTDNGKGNHDYTLKMIMILKKFELKDVGSLKSCSFYLQVVESWFECLKQHYELSREEREKLTVKMLPNHVQERKLRFDHNWCPCFYSLCDLLKRRGDILGLSVK